MASHTHTHSVGLRLPIDAGSPGPVHPLEPTPPHPTPPHPTPPHPTPLLPTRRPRNASCLSFGRSRGRSTPRRCAARAQPAVRPAPKTRPPLADVGAAQPAAHQAACAGCACTGWCGWQAVHLKGRTWWAGRRPPCCTEGMRNAHSQHALHPGSSLLRPSTLASTVATHLTSHLSACSACRMRRSKSSFRACCCPPARCCSRARACAT